MARRDDRIAEEIAFHIEQQTAKHIAAGMSPEDALRAARLKFGGVVQAREATRDELRGAWLRDFARDLRIACRSLARVPSFSVTAILTIGLGIGAAAAMFSVVDGVLLRPLPYPDSDRIVQLFQIGDTGRRGGNVSEPNFVDWQAQTRGFAAMAETAVFPQTVLGAGEPQSVPVATVSQGFFDVMGTRPARGRGFLAEELQRGAAPVALVGARFWERWKGDRPLSGESIVIGGVAHAVVGVMPPGFDYPREAAIWTPREQGSESPSRTAHNFRVVARVRPGIDIAGGLRRAEPRLARDEGPLRQRDDDGRRRRRAHPRRDDGRRPAGAAAAAGGRRSCCCSWPAPTSRTCWWRARPRGSASSPSSSRSARRSGG